MDPTYSGVWWLDQDSDLRVPGTLTRAERGWQLDLIGQFPQEDPPSDGLAIAGTPTVFGSCLGTLFTLPHAYLDSERNSRLTHIRGEGGAEHLDDQHTQRWAGSTLLKGGAMGVTALYRAALFELEHLPWWWPPMAGFLREGASMDDDWQQSEIIETPDGFTLQLFVDPSESVSRTRRTLQVTPVVSVRHDTGFTLEQLHAAILEPLRCLISIALHEPVAIVNLRLRPLVATSIPHHGRSDFSEIIVDPEARKDGKRAASVYLEPLFTAASINLPSFTQRWLHTASITGLAPNVARHRKTLGPLQTEVVAAVNAVEWVHRSLPSLSTPAQSGFARRVKEALAVQGDFKSSERSKVAKLVERAELTLERRLAYAVQDLGDGVGQWLFNGQVAHWAKVAATTRNTLAHGLVASHGFNLNYNAQVGVLGTAQAVLRLRLLVAAGLPGGRDLVTMLRKDPHYRAIRKQTIADWAHLASLT